MRKDPLTAIAEERERQIAAEGWTLNHDDSHIHGELAMAAGWYALNATSHQYSDFGSVAHPSSAAYPLFRGQFSAYQWPWNVGWWKPKDARRDLIRAGALIVAELERLDRAEASQS
ncbi:MAG: hypothetical protein GWN84_10315 [Gammaproteobacteria bacterium]|nr:hypothetical protein [Gammaproteobacteria bacterium]NIR29682.1 hypothetical protein [Gammaproteobacteria bacterium]NIR83259.1 hypothetical protein [Gammaproteobacteria bacterium]NIU04426.1 hypothetical protein [Gammaproteobacteria bacterium]NIV51583.1 hypothetical protein [Gammaproteobacteria bacterium]